MSPEVGHRAVFTVQGASSSHMAASTFLDAISRHRGTAREANDAVSAYTQVRMSEAPSLLRLPEKEYPQL